MGKNNNKNNRSTKRQNKNNKKRSNHKKKTLKQRGGFSNNENMPKYYGKLYAEWCGHCKALEKPWAEIEKRIGGSSKCLKFEDEQIKGGELDKFNEENNTDIKLQGGFPTIYKLSQKGGKVEYYDGVREVEPIVNWIKGGDDNTKEEDKKVEETVRQPEKVGTPTQPAAAPAAPNGIQSWFSSLFSRVPAKK